MKKPVFTGSGVALVTPFTQDFVDFDKLGELIDLGVKLDLVQKSGSWFAMGDIRLGQGRDAAKEYFRTHPEEADKLEAEIRKNAYKLMTRQSLAAAKAAGRMSEQPEEDAAADPAESED